VAEEDWHFKDFLKLVFLGDVELLLSRSRKAMSSNVVAGLDEELVSDDKRRLRYFGDPVKFAMSTQVLRNLPAITAVVPIVIFSLAIASLVKLTLPFIRRWPILFENVMGSPQEFGKWVPRRKREISSAQNATVSSHLEMVGVMLQKAVDGIEYLAQGFPDNGQQDQVFRYNVTKRSTKFAGYNERKARIQIEGVTEISRILRDWLRAWVNILPNIANCLGQLIGCHVQWSYWDSLCKPIVPVASCVSVFGFSLESLANVAYPY